MFLLYCAQPCKVCTQCTGRGHSYLCIIPLCTRCSHAWEGTDSPTRLSHIYIKNGGQRKQPTKANRAGQPSNEGGVQHFPHRPPWCSLHWVSLHWASHHWVSLHWVSHHPLFVPCNPSSPALLGTVPPVSPLGHTPCTKRSLPGSTSDRSIPQGWVLYISKKKIEMSEQTKISTVPTVPTVNKDNHTCRSLHQCVPIVVVHITATDVAQIFAGPDTFVHQDVFRFLLEVRNRYHKHNAFSCLDHNSTTGLLKTRTVVVNIRPRRPSACNRRRPCWRTSCKKSLVMLMCKAHGRNNIRALCWQHALEVYT